MRDAIFCISQVKTRPIISGADPVLQADLNKIRKRAEKEFLDRQQAYCNKWSLHYQNNVKYLVDILMQEMSNEPDSLFLETEKAITTVANRVRSVEYSKLYGRWSHDLATHEAKKYGDQPPKTQRHP